MTDYMLDLFASFFRDPTAWGIGLAFAFGAVWFAVLAPPVRRLGFPAAVVVAGLVLVFVSSAILTLTSICFIQVPLQTWASQALGHFWGQRTLLRWILLSTVPQILLSGLVQEAAKLVPPLVYIKWRRPPDARAALAIGAVAGVGFGVFEAAWALNLIFASGWSWDTVQFMGFEGLLGFWERFFAVALHTAATSISVYGLYKGKWWQYYLLAALLHAVTNYGVVLLTGGYLTSVQVEVYIAVIAVAAVGIALCLRWRREPAEPPAPAGRDAEEKELPRPQD
ncbi:MAG: YhfC family glutamic-type intramembrane protease [Chloroflexota bacterium]|nr:YhfC family glutamic-type intramembrane protease [Chloroflexota bacterium]